MQKDTNYGSGLLSKMADIPVPGYQAFSTTKRKMFKAEFQKLVGQYPDAEARLRQLFKVLWDIEDVEGYTPASIEESQGWRFIVSTMKENHANYCKALFGKTLYSAQYGAYTFTLNKLKSLLKERIFSEEKGTRKGTGEPHKEEGFQEVRRRNRLSIEETTKTVKKGGSPGRNASVSPKQLASPNFFTPLKTSMDTGSAGAETNTHEEAVHVNVGRQPVIILAVKTNLTQLQMQLKT
jgi:hypothetical protein